MLHGQCEECGRTSWLNDKYECPKCSAKNKIVSGSFITVINSDGDGGYILPNTKEANEFVKLLTNKKE